MFARTAIGVFLGGTCTAKIMHNMRLIGIALLLVLNAHAVELRHLVLLCKNALRRYVNLPARKQRCLSVGVLTSNQPRTTSIARWLTDLSEAFVTTRGPPATVGAEIDLNTIATLVRKINLMRTMDFVVVTG